MAERILIIEDEETLRESLKRVLAREGYVVVTVDNAEAALDIFQEGFYDLIITDIILPGITGIELLKKIKENLPEQMIVIITAYASLETAVEALRSGAYDYIVKPIMHEEIKQIVKNALRQSALIEENMYLRKQIEKQYDLNRLIYNSQNMKDIIDVIKNISVTDENVLLFGETGTGKELFARTIHSNSKYADRPFISINPASINNDEVEKTLLGYVKRSDEEAFSLKKGLFEKANGGTIFIREIADTDFRFQDLLLDVLEKKEVRPVNSKQSFKVSFRLISSTEKDIDTLSLNGRFNKRLLDAIKKIQIQIPSIRERTEDIKPLANYFLRKFSVELCKHIKEFDDNVFEYLKAYSWPGNVREIQNIVERAVLIARNEIIKTEDIKRILPLS